MNGQHNSVGKILIQIAASFAIIGLILSISRIFLSDTDRNSIIFWYGYDLTITSQMIAFLSVVIISVLFLALGVFLNKARYDIIGYPLIIASLISLIFISISAYAIQSLSDYSYYYELNVINKTSAELVLTIVIGFEWLALLIYCWTYKNKPSIINNPPTPPVVPTQESNLS